MCVPHGKISGVYTTDRERKKNKKSIKRVSQDIFEKGDPNFIDERTKEYIKPLKKQSWFGSFINRILDIIS